MRGFRTNIIGGILSKNLNCLNNENFKLSNGSMIGERNYVHGPQTDQYAGLTLITDSVDFSKFKQLVVKGSINAPEWGNAYSQGILRVCTSSGQVMDTIASVANGTGGINYVKEINWNFTGYFRFESTCYHANTSAVYFNFTEFMLNTKVQTN